MDNRDLIEKNDTIKSNKLNKSVLIICLTVFVCVGVVVSAILLPQIFNSSNRHLSKNDTDMNLAGQRLLNWDERSISSKYDSLYINAKLFSSTEKTVDNSEINEFICKTTVVGYDYADTDYILENNHLRQFSINAEIYSVKGIESDFLVAVKYENNDGFYSFIPAIYEPQTLGDLISNLNLTNNLLIKDAYTKEQDNKKVYNIADNKVFWDMLNSNKDAKYIGADTKYDFSYDMTINVSMNIAGQSDKIFVVSKDGYIFTNIYGGGKVYSIGKEAANDFINNVLTNVDQ